MDKLSKSVVYDDAMHPVAVQIAYADWLEVEKRLGIDEAPPGTDLNQFGGTISLAEDPLEYQRRVRREWQ
jgi:hypothetical protein